MYLSCPVQPGSLLQNVKAKMWGALGADLLTGLLAAAAAASWPSACPSLRSWLLLLQPPGLLQTGAAD